MLLKDMATPPSDINLRAPLAVDISRINVSRGVTYRVPRDVRRRNFGLIDDFFEISLDIVTETASAAVITVHIWLLSVTESVELPPKQAVAMSDIRKFDLREWLVPPILVPLFLGLIVAGAVVVRW